jgi:hypothetical protein
MDTKQYDKMIELINRTPKTNDRLIENARKAFGTENKSQDAVYGNKSQDQTSTEGNQ